MNELLRRLLFLPPQASRMAAEVDALHYIVISVTLVASVLVGAVAWLFIVRYRQTAERATTTRVVSSRAFEIPMIAFVLGLFLLWWVIGFRQYIQMETPSANALDIYVTAKQWMWKFSYPDGRIAADRLTVPAGKPVRLIMTSRDVIHSLYIPALRMKQDVIPGRYVTMGFTADRPGVYPINCAEYCGTSHSRMPGEFVVLSEGDYASWLTASSATEGSGSDDRTGPSDSSLTETGRAVAARHACFACHTLGGQRHIGPTWRGLYDSAVKLTDGRVIIADVPYLTKSMMEPNADIVDGFAPIMPTYVGLLTEPEVAALVEFMKSLRDAPAEPGVVLPTVVTRPAP